MGGRKPKGKPRFASGLWPAGLGGDLGGNLRNHPQHLVICEGGIRTPVRLPAQRVQGDWLPCALPHDWSRSPLTRLCRSNISTFTAHRNRYRFRHMSKPQKVPERRRRENVRFRHTAPSPLIGYMRVSKADGSQVLDLQRDALLAAGVTERHLYSDTASGKKDDRPGLAACLQALREGDALVVWKLIA